MACLQPIKADPLPCVTHSWGRFWCGLHSPLPPARSSAWPVTSSVYLLRIPALFRLNFSMATPTRSEGGSFERGDQNEQLSPSQLFDWSSRS